MNNQQAYNTYLRSKVLTATPGELTLMLYDGAIRFANVAIRAMEEKDIQKAHDNIIRTENIITELQTTLNFDYEVAKDFNNIYEYLQQRLVDANLEKNPTILEEVVKHLRSVRDTWKEVMKVSAKQQAPAQQIAN